MRYMKVFASRPECEEFKKKSLYRPYVYYITSEDKVEYGPITSGILSTINGEPIITPSGDRLIING